MKSVIFYSKSNVVVKCVGFCKKSFYPQCVNFKYSDVRSINSKGDRFGLTCRQYCEKIAENTPIVHYLDLILNIIKETQSKLCDHNEKINSLKSQLHNNQTNTFLSNKQQNTITNASVARGVIK